MKLFIIKSTSKKKKKSILHILYLILTTCRQVKHLNTNVLFLSFLFFCSTKHQENYYATDDSYYKMPRTHTDSKLRVFQFVCNLYKIEFHHDEVAV